MAYLEAKAGGKRSRKISLTSKLAVLGRSSECDVVVDADSVSRRHAKILLIGRDYYVEDLNSSNGTVVNNQVIHSRVRLHEGDSIRLSQFEFLFRESIVPIGSHGNVDRLPDQRGIIDEDHDAPRSHDTGVYLKLTSSADSGVHTVSHDSRFEALLEATQTLGKFLSLEKLLPQILDSVFKMLPQSDRGCIILKDASGQLKPGWVKVRHGELRVSRTVITEVMESKTAIVTSNAATDSRFAASQSISDFQLKSVMCAPLIDHDGEVLGVLQVDTSDVQQTYQQDDLRILVAMATQASVAITVAKLHEAEVHARTLERELHLAAEVQRNSLPEQRPVANEYEFYDYYDPAEKVGGDFFDYIPLPDGRFGIVIGDVVGHGVPAALVMSKILAETRFLTASLQDPAAVIDVLNGVTCRSKRLGRFITMLMLVLDPASHRVTLASAGHLPPLLGYASGEIGLPGRDEYGPPLGASKDAEYQTHSFQLEPGDLLLLHTDGVTEAESANDMAFGDDRLADLVRRSTSPTEAVQSVVEGLNAFVGEQAHQDDVCVVCFGRSDVEDV